MRTSNTRPPGPRGRVMSSGLPVSRAFIRDPLGFFSEMASYGDISYFTTGPQENFLLNNPDDIRTVLAVDHRSFEKGHQLDVARRVIGQGLITSGGEVHRRHRRLAQPAFHRARIEGYAWVMSDSARRQSEGWRDGDELDLQPEMSRLALTIVGNALFGTDLGDETGRRVTRALAVCMEMFDVADPAARFGESSELLSAMDYLDTLTYRLIHERRASGEDRGDLLSMLIMASDEESGESMTDVQIRDECMTLVLAGHETTANLLTWTFWLLDGYPDVEARLHRELEEVLAGRQPQLEDIPRLEYTRRVIHESLRIRPPVWILARRAIVDYQLHEYTIPEGSSVLMSQWVTHHDPRWFPTPERFDPDRWTPEAEASRPKYSYYPFGSGPRRCIGESFAKLEASIVLATLAQRWKLRLVPEHRVEMFPSIALRSRYGMRMSLEARTDE
jgi:cytochrome P450